MKPSGTVSVYTGMSRLKKLPSAAVLGFALLAGTFFVALSPAAQAQQIVKARRLDGTVTSDSGIALAGSVVYLKNTNTLAIRSYVADGMGAFHFGQLGTDSDYQVWARYGGRKSNVKTVSAMENKTVFHIALKINTTK